MNRACLHLPSWRAPTATQARELYGTNNHSIRWRMTRFHRTGEIEPGRDVPSQHAPPRSGSTFNPTGWNLATAAGAAPWRSIVSTCATTNLFRRTRDGTGWRACGRSHRGVCDVGRLHPRTRSRDRQPRRVAVEVTDGNHEPLMAAVLTVGFVPVARIKRRDKAIAYRQNLLKFRHSGRSTAGRR
jgi:hypothetical protein